MLKKKGMLTEFTGIFFLALALLGNYSWSKEPKQIPITDPTARAWQIIDEAIANKDPDKRQLIVEAGSLGGSYPKVFEFLAKASEDKKEEVRLAACHTLSSLKDPASIPTLKKLIKDPVPEVVFCSALGLYHLGDPLGEKALLEIIEGEKKGESGFFSANEREALATFNSKGRFFSTLFHLGIRFAPVPGLAMGFSSMEALMSEKGAKGKVMIALAFAKGDDPATLQALVAALKDKDPAVRAAAVHSLALRNDPSVRGDLIPLMDDKKEMVSYRAAVAYLRLNKVEADKAAQAQAMQSDVETQESKPRHGSHSR
jgi:HEAT repeat protein